MKVRPLKESFQEGGPNVKNQGGGLMGQVVGHSSSVSWLLDQAQKGRLPSSMIFQGPQGVGKKLVALGLLQVMNCTEEPLSCGRCSACVRVLQPQNEMLYTLERQDKKNIGVESVREVHHFLHLKSLRPARFVLMDGADGLSPAGANALLKVLEEAPPQTHFILITHRPGELLPTIRSRSHLVKFHPLSRSELKSHGGFHPMALDWSGGRLQRALELQEEKARGQLNQSLKFLYSLLYEPPQDWKKMAPWFFEKTDQSRQGAFDVWAQALEKRLYAQGENLDWLPQERAALIRIYQGLERLQEDLRANGDKLLALERFYYEAHTS